MRHTRHHFSHGGELFFLQLLLFRSAGLSDVTGRSDHAIDFSRRVEQRTRAGTQHSPGSIGMLRAVFKLRVRQLAVRELDQMRW